MMNVELVHFRHLATEAMFTFVKTWMENKGPTPYPTILPEGELWKQLISWLTLTAAARST